MAGSPFANRLQKNFRHFRKWEGSRQTTAFRVFDHDIPDFPFAVDWYAGRVQLSEFPRRSDLKDGAHAQRREQVRQDILEVLGVASGAVFLKTHLPKVWGKEQYERAEASADPFVVRENGLQFWVDLRGHLDSGLFMDHRDTRARFRGEAAGKRVLNLFAYTGAFTVYAAAGGAKGSTSVDLSNTYVDWAVRNLKLNGVQGSAHPVVRADVLRWLEEAASGPRYDLAIVDPPSFSASQRAKTFDVQKDHPRLLSAVRRLLAPGAVLYFSTNFQQFQLDPAAFAGAPSEELTPRSIPEDFHDKKIHRCWRVVTSG